MDLHAAQIQGFFDIPVDHLVRLDRDRQALLEHAFRAWRPHVLVSPDVGNVKVANILRRNARRRPRHYRQAA